MRELKIYIILINFKNALDTIECLESLFKIKYTNYRIVVVDNSPDDTSLKDLLAWAEGKFTPPLNSKYKGLVYPLTDKPISYSFIKEGSPQYSKITDSPLVFIKPNSNKGFAGGNNLALRWASENDSFSFVWLINNDTVVDPQALNELLQYYRDQHSGGNNIGILGSTLLYYHTPEKVQGVGGLFNKVLATTSHQGDGMLVQKINSVHLPIDYVIGASMFLSKSFLEKVGLMDEDYFLYFEEIDWTIRAKEHGYSVSYCPNSFVYHKEGSSINNSTSYTKKKSDLADYYALRNRVLFTKKHFPQYLPFIYISFIWVAVNRIRRSEFGRLQMIFKILINPSKHYQD